MHKLYYLIMGLFFLGACNQNPKLLDVQGHRGARGLIPENTIPGFIKAVELGVTTLEMDVVISEMDRWWCRTIPISTPISVWTATVRK
jgi:glycerophosphoryl diester phosphodiesterase